MRLKVLLLAAIFAISVMGFYSPAQAADGVTPYANIATWAAWTINSKEKMSPTDTNAKSDMDYSQGNFANAGSNMGLKGEKNGVTAQIEFGVETAYQSFRSRHVFASYKMGELGILFGQTLAPWVGLDGADLRSGDAMATAGSCYDGWASQIRLSFFGAYVQIMNPIGVAQYYDAVLPKIGAGYMFKTDMFSISANVVGQQLKRDKELAVAGANYTMDGAKLTSYLANVIFKANFGPANVSAVAFYSKNRGNMGFATSNLNQAGTSSAVAIMNTTSDGYEDTTSMGGRVGAGFKAGMAKFNVGLGYEKDENDLASWTEGDNDTLTYFANVQLFLVDNFYIAPEVKVIDARKSETGVKQGKVTYVGFACVASI